MTPILITVGAALSVLLIISGIDARRRPKARHRKESRSFRRHADQALKLVGGAR